MKLQRQLSNGQWVDENRVDYFVGMVLDVEPRMAKFEKRHELTSAQDVIDYLATGRQLRYDTEWYENIRDADAIKPRTRPQVELIRCDCGHSSAHPMTTASGTSCPDCYDRMSYE